MQIACIPHEPMAELGNLEKDSLPLKYVEGNPNKYRFFRGLRLEWFAQQPKSWVVVERSIVAE